MYTYYNVWEQTMNDAAKANLRELLSFNQWMASWYSFLELLDIDYEDGFCCPTCGKDNLDVVVCDGTSRLSFRQAFCTDVRSGLEAVQTDKLLRGTFCKLLFSTTQPKAPKFATSLLTTSRYQDAFAWLASAC